MIVLAFVVLLTGLVVAYFSRTTTERQISSGSSNDIKVDELAKSALDLIAGNMKQEIASGAPITSANVVPQRSPRPAYGGNNPVFVITNLVRRSVRNDSIPAPAVPSLASAVNSTSDPSLNGRSISLARWNAHYLVAKANTGNNLSDPVTTGFTGPDFWSPDWVLVTRNGPMVEGNIGSGTTAISNSTSSNQNYVIGRYAYAIYDEGGLLDANVVGLPSPTPSVTDLGRKGSPALADLTGLKTTSSVTGAPPAATPISKLVAWRNYATLQSSGTFPDLSPPPNATPFVNYALNKTRDFRTTAGLNYLGRTDQSFLTRRQLIEYFRSAGTSFNWLQFLGTFSRERNIPTYQAGSAALTARFDIGKLGLVKDNPDDSQTVDIQKFFGLKWIAGSPAVASPPTPAIPGHWQYIGPSGTDLRSSIPAFTSEPEFFQLLNYAVYSTTSDDSAHIATTLTVGATIIDQYDDDTSADSLTSTTTTMIEYGGGYVVGMENVDPARSPTPPPPGISPTPRPAIAGYTMLNRPFRNVGEFGYALRPEKSPVPQTVDFDTAASADAAILDLFTYNTAPVRAGIVNLNTSNPGPLAALIKGTITAEPTGSPAGITASTNAVASPTPNPLFGIIGNSTIGTFVQPALGRKDIARLTAAAGSPLGSSDEQKETIARALADLTQTRTWGLFIDLVAQTGRYPTTASSLSDFVVQGEKRYWLHIAIDRFTGEVVDQQLEAVQE